MLGNLLPYSCEISKPNISTDGVSDIGLETSPHHASQDFPLGKHRITLNRCLPKFLSDKKLGPSFCFRAPSHCARHRLTFRSIPPPPLLTFPSPDAPAHKDCCRPRRLLRWQVQNLPRVPYSSGSHCLLLHAGHRAVHQLVEKLPEDWRVVVVERNTCVSPFSPSHAYWGLI